MRDEVMAKVASDNAAAVHAKGDPGWWDCSSIRGGSDGGLAIFGIIWCYQRSSGENGTGSRGMAT
jgi:hypothetical protein